MSTEPRMVRQLDGRVREESRDERETREHLERMRHYTFPTKPGCQQPEWYLPRGSETGLF